MRHDCGSWLLFDARCLNEVAASDRLPELADPESPIQTTTPLAANGLRVNAAGANPERPESVDGAQGQLIPVEPTYATRRTRRQPSNQGADSGPDENVTGVVHACVHARERHD